MTWLQPSFAPQTYQVYRHCRRLCEQIFDPTIISDSSISSPYTFSGIDPGTYCIVGLNGTYGNEPASLGVSVTNLLSSGKLCYIHNHYVVLTLSTAPTSSVSNIIISSVEARSMTVSWNEVPCSGQNGPITGYLLYYTNTTFSDTVNITGGDNRQYNLTTLTPYTNYTVTVIAYNDVGTGPANSEVIQETGEAGKSVTTDI